MSWKLNLPFESVYEKFDFCSVRQILERFSINKNLLTDESNCRIALVLRYYALLRHILNQSDAKPKPITTWSHAFSRAWRRLRAFALSSHWLVLVPTSVVIGQCNCLVFGFTTLEWKPLYFKCFSCTSILNARSLFKVVLAFILFSADLFNVTILLPF